MEPSKLIKFLIGILILGIGIIIGLLIGKYIYTPRPTSPIVSTSPTPVSITDPTANWKTYEIKSNGLTFKYPLDKELITGVSGYNPFKPDEKYSIALGGSDQIYLDIFLFKSTKTPVDWWNSVGRSRFEELATTSGELTNPPVVFSLTYKTRDTTMADKEAFRVTVFSNYETPFIPKENNLVIFQNQGYITMATYHDIESSPNLGSSILSTFRFVNSSSDQKYTCPINGWANCMPILNAEGKKNCSPEALDWYKKNCPNFQGVAQ